MGYALMFGTCVACKSMISFNPHKVPSIKVNGHKEPLCRACAKRWNTLHPNEARPIQPGAYDVMDENEL